MSEQEETTVHALSSGSNDKDGTIPMGPTLDSTERKNTSLPVYVTTLGLNDLNSLVQLEAATFPENQRCTREKVFHSLGSVYAHSRHLTC